MHCRLKVATETCHHIDSKESQQHKLVPVAGALASVGEAFVAPNALRTCVPASRHTLHMASTSDFKTGLTIEVDGSPVRVQEFLHVKVRATLPSISVFTATLTSSAVHIAE